MPRKAKKLTNLSINWISLVKDGANQRQFIYKSDSDPDSYNLEREVNIAKYDNEKGIAYGVIYPADEVDSQGHFATVDDLEKAAHSFIENGQQRNIDTDHSFEKVNASIVESWIAKDGDQFGKAGDWCGGIKIYDEDIKKKIKDGEIKAFSMAGKANMSDIELPDGDTPEKTEKSPQGAPERERTLLEKALSKIEEVFAFLKGEKVEKDFNDNLAEMDFWRLTEALNQALRDAMKMEDKAQRKAEMLASIDQFRAYIDGMELLKSETETSRIDVLAELTKINETIATVADAVENLAKVRGSGSSQQRKGDAGTSEPTKPRIWT
jgi:hypothetical protein